MTIESDRAGYGCLTVLSWSIAITLINYLAYDASITAGLYVTACTFVFLGFVFWWKYDNVVRRL